MAATEGRGAAAIATIGPWLTEAQDNRQVATGAPDEVRDRR
jgi:hypothetical protein